MGHATETIGTTGAMGHGPCQGPQGPQGPWARDHRDHTRGHRDHIRETRSRWPAAPLPHLRSGALVKAASAMESPLYIGLARVVEPLVRGPWASLRYQRRPARARPREPMWPKGPLGTTTKRPRAPLVWGTSLAVMVAERSGTTLAGTPVLPIGQCGKY